MFKSTQVSKNTSSFLSMVETHTLTTFEIQIHQYVICNRPTLEPSLLVIYSVRRSCLGCHAGSECTYKHDPSQRVRIPIELIWTADHLNSLLFLRLIVGCQHCTRLTRFVSLGMNKVSTSRVLTIDKWFIQASLTGFTNNTKAIANRLGTFAQALEL